MRGTPPAGPRVLLRRLREIMAEPISAQARLDKIVTQIAANMVAEVCSVYVLHADGVLELYATEGLKAEAVHHASLRVGQGLVGSIAEEARPLNLPDAQSHPAFRYIPETGEEIYHSFLGVPVLRAGRTLGVLVVQNTAHRTYHEEEVEALQTTAMVLAEMIMVGELSGLGRPGTSLELKRPIAISGLPLCEGVGLGLAVLHEPRVVVTALVGEDATVESRRLDEAIAGLRLFVDDMLSRDDIATAGEHRDVLEAYRMFANDRGWVRRMQEAIRNGLSAEGAVEKVQSDMRARMLRQTAPFLRERLHDFDDLTNRLLRVLMNKPHGPGRRGTAQGRHHRGAQHGRRRAARLRPRAHPRAGSGRGRTDQPCDRRGPRPRHCRGRPRRQCRGAGRQWRRRHRRRDRRRGASAPQSRRRSRLRREGALPRQAAGAVSASPWPAVGDHRRAAGEAADECRACSSTCRIWSNRAPKASACSAPSCSSWSPRPCRAWRSRRRSTARCSGWRATSR